MTERVLNHQYLGRKDKPGDVGLELEVEADRPLPVITGDWLSKEEGSLRGYSMEYVTNGPIACDENKFTKIKELTDVLNSPDLRVNKESPRTSLHVHVNIGRLTPNQTWTAASSYWLFENLLLEYCGTSRKGNLFCLRAKDAEGSIRTCMNSLKQKTPFTSLKTDIIRYASQNMNAIPKFGSIEYRGMRGTLDPEIIDTWSTQLYRCTRNASLQFSDPSELLDKYYSETNKKAFLERFFDPGFVQRLTAIPGWVDLIDSNVDLLLEFAYYFNDWRKYQDRLEDHFSKNPIPLTDPSRLPLGVILTPDQVSIAMEHGYPIIAVRRGYQIPFEYNTEGLKIIDWSEEVDYLYAIGDQNICPFIPRETRTSTAQAPINESYLETTLRRNEELVASYRRNVPNTLGGSNMGTTQTLSPLRSYPIAFGTAATEMWSGDTTITHVTMDAPTYPPVNFDYDSPEGDNT